MIYENLVRMRNNYNQAIKFLFLSDLDYKYISINDNLLENNIEVCLTKADFKDLYNEIRLSPHKRKKLKIVIGLKPLFVNDGKATFFYKSGNITYVFYRNHPSRVITINDAINQHKLEQEILNM